MDHVRFNPANPQPTQPSSQCDRAWIEGRIALLLSAYRRDDYQHPEMFVQQVRMNLERFPMEVVEYVTNPTTGIQTKSQWPPSLAEIVKACEAELIHRENINRYASMPPPLPRLPGPRFAVQDSYEEMTKKHGRPFGPFEQGRQLLYNPK